MKTNKIKVGASRELKLAPAADFDADTAGAEILEVAGFGGDSPDTTAARKGFLAYDAGNPEDVSAYRIPFAKMVAGELIVSRASVEAARKDVNAAELPADVRQKAVAVLDAYDARLKSAERAKDAPKMTAKSLWHVAQLASILDDLDWLEECVEWEAEIEQDGSNMPAMLASIMAQMGAALIAMTQEEVAELIGEEAGESDSAAMSAEMDDENGEMGMKTVPFLTVFAGKKATLKDVISLLAAKAVAENATVTPDTDETAAAADTVKAIDDAKAKRLREIEILRLKVA